MEIDLKNFIEGNDDLFTMTNFKDAEIVLNNFLEWYKKALIIDGVVGQSEQYCDCDVKGSFDEEIIHRCRKCDKVME